MKRILITGANGYIGRNVIQEMIKRKIDFIATDCISTDLDDKIEFIECDIFNCENIFEKLGKPDIILHLAWRNGFVHNAETHMGELSQHYMFLSRMIEAGVQKICVMGSMHEVGYHVGIIDEDTPTKPLSQYGVAKNALRQSLQLLCKEKSVIFQWIRGFYTYGDDVHGNSIFAKLQQNNLDGKVKFPFTSGRNKFDFISIYDLSEQICAVVTQDKINGTINCCSGKAISLAEQVEWYIKEYHLNIELEYGAYPDRPYDSPELWGDNKNIQEIMNNLRR